MFTQASERGEHRLADILHIYKEGSNQMVNSSKSAVFFSANCNASILKEEMKQTTGIQTEDLCEKYLGLPTAIGHSTTEAFNTDPGKDQGFGRGLQ